MMNMKNIRMIVGAILITLLVVVLVQNSSGVTLTFIAVNFQLPLFLVVLLFTLIGFALGWIFRVKR
jgi:uncharacterized integral membrane protein